MSHCKKLVAVAGGLAVLAGLTSGAAGAIIYSGEINESIDSDGSELFVNVVSGDIGSSPSSGYDFSISKGLLGFGDWQFTWNDNGFNNTNEAVSGDTQSEVGLLEAGHLISGAEAFTEGGTDSAAEFSSVDEGYFGFRFLNEDLGTYHFAWGRVSLPSSGDGVLIDYAYESQPGSEIAAGAGIPEPTSLALLSLGGLALIRRRGQ